MSLFPSHPSASRSGRRRAPGLLAAALLTVLVPVMTQAREIVDMAGRSVMLPDKIHRLHAAQPYTHVLAYMVAPDLLVGHLSVLRESERRFLRPEAAALPMLGGNPGGGPAVNMETVLAAHPDLVLMKGNRETEISRPVEQFSKLGLPVVFVDLEDIDDYPAGIEFLGRLVGREEKAQAMADHARQVLAAVDRAVATVPEEQRVRVYYAESADGLATECDASFHAAAIKRAGGRIVHHCLLKSHMGMEKVSLEQVIAYDPEVIVSQDPQFEATVYADPRWAGVKAVARRQVWTVPRTPFNWIDRPPSVMRIIGIQWLAKRFYPQAYAIDLRRELQDFHRLYLGISPKAEDLDQWLK